MVSRAAVGGWEVACVAVVTPAAVKGCALQLACRGEKNQTALRVLRDAIR